MFHHSNASSRLPHRSRKPRHDRNSSRFGQLQYFRIVEIRQSEQDDRRIIQSLKNQLP